MSNLRVTALIKTLLVLSVLLCPATSASVWAQTGSVQGQVFDAATSLGISPVYVEFVSEDGQTRGSELGLAAPAQP